MARLPDKSSANLALWAVLVVLVDSTSEGPRTKARRKGGAATGWMRALGRLAAARAPARVRSGAHVRGGASWADGLRHAGTDLYLSPDTLIMFSLVCQKRWKMSHSLIFSSTRILHTLQQDSHPFPQSQPRAPVPVPAPKMGLSFLLLK